MSWTDRVWSWLGGRERRDARPALPGPALQHRNDDVYAPWSGFGDPNVDKGADLRPNPYRIPLTDEELQSAYEGDGLPSRVINVLPSRGTRRGWSVPDVGISFDRDLDTWGRVCLGSQAARALGGAGGLLVTEDDVPRRFHRDPSRWAAEPLDLARVGKLRNLVIFDAVQARPIEWETSLSERGYGLPRLWSIAVDGRRIVVHSSRFLHFRSDRRLPSQIRNGWTSNGWPDQSVLQRIWNDIARLEITMQGGAVLAQELRTTILQIADLPEKQVGDEADAFNYRMSWLYKFKSTLHAILLGKEDKYESLANTPAGFEELSEGAKSMLCTVLGWPASMLTGEPPGGLSTDDESGRERERQIVSDYQEFDLREPLTRLYEAVYASQDGPTRGVIPDEWEVTFAPLDEPTALQTATLRSLVATTDVAMIGAKVIRPQDVTTSRYGEDGWSLDLQPVDPVDPVEEAKIQAETMKIVAEAMPPEPGAEGEEEGGASSPPKDREDAIDADSVSILVPAADPGLQFAVSAAIGQSLEVEHDPHVTVLYLGRGHGQRKIAEIIRTATEEARSMEPGTLMHGTLRAFPPGPNGTPIVVEFTDDWAVSTLHARLLHRLAHLVRAKLAGRGYRAHLTVGYARNPLSPEASTALLGVDASAVRVGVGELRVSVGGTIVATIPIGA